MKMEQNIFTINALIQVQNLKKTLKNKKQVDYINLLAKNTYLSS